MGSCIQGYLGEAKISKGGVCMLNLTRTSPPPPLRCRFKPLIKQPRSQGLSSLPPWS